MAVTDHSPTIALLPWGDVFEDFLDTIGVSLEKFCNDMAGGWLFGYVEALQLTGVQVTIIIISSQVTTPTHLTHAPTKAPIIVLPSPKLYRLTRWFTDWLERQTGGLPRFLFPLLPFLHEVLPYISTPVGAFIRELRRGSYSAILSQEYEYSRFDVCMLVGLLTNLPVFTTFQGGIRARGWLGRFIRSILLRRCAGLIIAPRSEAERVQTSYNVPHEKIGQIFNPLDLQQWGATDCNQARSQLNVPLDAQVVVWHGRISIQIKGLDILLDAWERICRERPEQDLQLLLLGTGEDAEKFRQCLAEKQVQGVRWVNEYIHDRTEIQRYLSIGNVYAFSSRREGFPVAPLEAMACSLPVVTTDVQGIPDIFDGGEEAGGIIVPRENAIELALALGRVLDDTTWGRELGKRARCRVEDHFSLEAVGKKLQAFLLTT